jgi:hypothetical protein
MREVHKSLQSDSHLQATWFFRSFLSQNTEHVLFKNQSIEHAGINLDWYEFSVRNMSKMCMGITRVSHGYHTDITWVSHGYHMHIFDRVRCTCIPLHTASLIAVF